MRHRAGISEVVRGHDLDVRAERMLGAEEVTTDAAEAVDADANRHIPVFLALVKVTPPESNVPEARPPRGSSEVIAPEDPRLVQKELGVAV